MKHSQPGQFKFGWLRLCLPPGRVPEPLRGSDLDPRISYPPVIVKSDGPKQLFIRFMANSYRKLKVLVVRIWELLNAPDIL
jgi:hypothetical protein